MKRAKETDPRVLLTLALEAEAIRIEQGEVAYQEFKARQLAFCHEAHPGRVVLDLVERLVTLAQMPCVWSHMHLMPRTGVGALREILKLTVGGPISRNEQLKSLLERGTVNPKTTREDIDNIRSAQKMAAGRTEVAPRHRGQRT